MRLLTRLLAVCGSLAFYAAALAGGGLRTYLASPESAAETVSARAALEQLAAQLEGVEKAEGKICATGLAPLMLQLRDQLQPQGRRVLEAELAAFLARPTLDTFYDAPLAPFRVHYSLTGVDSVRDGKTDTLADGRPRYVHVAADALTHAWQVLVDSLGYPPPLSDSGAGGGSNLHDCYLAHSGIANVIGFTAAELWYGKVVNGHTIRIATSWNLVHPTMAPFLQVKDPLDLLRITCAHEFFHTIHFTYDLDEKPSWQSAGYLLEGSAVWFEDFAYPNVNDWSNLPYYLNSPERSITESHNLSDLHPYGGGSMWMFYLVERFGGPDILRQIWDRCGKDSADNTLAAMDSVLHVHGTSLEAAWHEFASWCMHTGNRHDATSFSQGADWPKVQPTLSLFEYPTAVHFSNGSDNLESTLDPQVPVVTVGPGGTPVAALGFAALAHIPFPSQRPDSAMRFYVQTQAGLPVQFQYVGLDTSLATPAVAEGNLPTGDTTLVPGWLRMDTLFTLASVAVHYLPGDTTTDPLADVTPLLSAALDSGGVTTSQVHFENPYPNPLVIGSDPGVQFIVTLPSAAQVWLDIFNASGDRVRSLEVQSSVWPPADLVWDGLNEAGSQVASGLYLCKLTVELTGSGSREEKLFRVGVVR